jgi:hypothetical protein
MCEYKKKFDLSASFFFLIITIIGNIMLMNLFLSIMMYNYQESILYLDEESKFNLISLT